MEISLNAVMICDDWELKQPGQYPATWPSGHLQKLKSWRNMMNELLIYAGGAVVLTLLAIAIYLHWRLYVVNKQIQQRQKEADAQYLLARQQLNQSIQIICRALLARQVEYAEASLRVSALMDQLSVNGTVREEFVAFDKLAQSIAHIPILDAWRELPREQKREFESQIEHQEQLLGDFVRDAAQRMIGRSL